MIGIKGMIRSTALVATFVAALGLSGASQSDWFAHLDGSQEVPPVETAAVGHAALELSEDMTTLAFSLSFEGIDPANVTGAHIHVGAAGANGPVIFDLLAVQPVPGPYTPPITGLLTAVNLTPQPADGVATFEDALLKIASGLAYVNVHTTAFPDGEIRGQIGLVVDLKVRKAINPRSNGVISVWILSVPGFDALTVDPATVAFGPMGAWSAGRAGDANDDGLMDLGFKFRTRESGIQCGDTSVTLEGATYDGLLVEGSRAIKTPGCKGKKGGHGNNGNNGGGHGDDDDDNDGDNSQGGDNGRH